MQVIILSERAYTHRVCYLFRLVVHTLHCGASVATSGAPPAPVLHTRAGSKPCLLPHAPKCTQHDSTHQVLQNTIPTVRGHALAHIRLKCGFQSLWAGSAEEYHPRQKEYVCCGRPPSLQAV